MSLPPGLYIEGKLTELGDDTLHFGSVRVVFRYDERKHMLALRDALLAKYPLDDYTRTCDFCDSPATTTEQDELGNDCVCCEDHAQTLAAKKRERVADEWYDREKG